MRGVDIEGTSDMLSVISSEAETTSWEIAFNEGRTTGRRIKK